MTNENTELIGRFVVYLRAERGASENTIESYQSDIEQFAGWLLKPLTAVQRTDLQRYVSDVLAAGKTGRTAARYLASLRTFYRFLVDEADIAHDPTRNLPVPKSWKRVPKALSQADLETMIASLGSTRLDARDKAMLLVFFGSGLRESELAALKVQDIDLEAGIAKVWNGKGGKDGIVPLSPRAITALREHLGNRTTGFVFPGRDGKRLTRMAIYYRIRDTAQAALGKHVSPHFLRHGFATTLVEGGADIRDVQVLMRHSSVDTTQIYVHIDLNFLRRIYYATHPRARIAAS